MRIYKILVPGVGNISYYDAIEHEGLIWLVTGWLEAVGQGYKIPVRIIGLDFRKYQKLDPPLLADFSLRAPIPKAVFEGRDPQPERSGYLVRERPDIRVPVRAGEFH